MRASSFHAPSARRALSSVSLALALFACGSFVPDRAEGQEAPPHAPPGYATQPAGAVSGPASSAQPLPGTPPPSYGYVPVAPLGASSPQLTPPMRRVEVERTETIRGLWLPGLIVLPIAWVTTWTAASSAFYGDTVTYSWIPVVGPWLMLTQDLNGYEGGAIVSGVVQGAATLAILLGLSIRRTYTAYEYVIEPAPGARLRFDAISLPGGGMVGASLEL